MYYDRRPSGSTVLRGLATVALAAGLLQCSNAPKLESAATSLDCDDHVSGVEPLPASAGAFDLELGVGEGDVWFLAPAPEEGSWSSRLEARGSQFYAKLPVYVDGQDLPSVTVRQVGNPDATGAGELSRTDAGLPGPVPMGVTLPGPGCWSVEVAGARGTARIHLRAG